MEAADWKTILAPQDGQLVVRMGSEQVHGNGCLVSQPPRRDIKGETLTIVLRRYQVAYSVLAIFSRL